jgi:RNA polymerase subunit RPABC4/transcription elongation factor Spt4
VFCSDCGESLSHNARFCASCGTEVESGANKGEARANNRAEIPSLIPQERGFDGRFAWLVIAGGMIAAVSTFMPWISASAILGLSIYRSAWQLGNGLSDDGTGPLLLILSLLLACVGWSMLSGRVTRIRGKGVSFIFEVVLFALLILEYKSLTDFTNQVGTKYVVASVGFGYWICGVGTLVALVGSVKYPRIGRAKADDAAEFRKWCENCNKEVESNAEFCSICGTKTQEINIWECTECEGLIGLNDNFCPTCGTSTD